jgi:hypothetical protein
MFPRANVSRPVATLTTMASSLKVSNLARNDFPSFSTTRISSPWTNCRRLLQSVLSDGGLALQSAATIAAPTIVPARIAFGFAVRPIIMALPVSEAQGQESMQRGRRRAIRP